MIVCSELITLVTDKYVNNFITNTTRITILHILKPQPLKKSAPLNSGVFLKFNFHKENRSTWGSLSEITTVGYSYGNYTKEIL